MLASSCVLNLHKMEDSTAQSANAVMKLTFLMPETKMDHHKMLSLYSEQNLIFNETHAAKPTAFRGNHTQASEGVRVRVECWRPFPRIQSHAGREILLPSAVHLEERLTVSQSVS